MGGILNFPDPACGHCPGVTHWRKRSNNMDKVNGLGVQSYCYRGTKGVSALIAAVQATGVDRIELCGVHADFMQRGQHADVIESFRRAGIRIVSIGVNGISGDEAAARPLFDFLKASGARHMSVSFDIHAQPACKPAPPPDSSAHLALAGRLCHDRGSAEQHLQHETP